jgi:hypothetical protein
VTVLILVGTRKGLFQLEGDEGRRTWTLQEPTLTGWEVFHAVRDPRDGNIHAATNSWAYGPTTHRSTDRGVSWERVADIGLPESSGLTLEKTWHVEPGPAAEPGVLYLGGTPGALLRSSDGGASWEAVRGVVETDARPLAAGRRRHVLPLDPAGAERERQDVYRHLRGGRVPLGRRRRNVEADQQERRRRLHARPVPGARPVRPQAAPPPRAAGAALATESLRCLPLRRPRRKLGASRRQRPPERVRLRPRAASTRPRHRLRDPRGRRREPCHLRRAARRLPHARCGRDLGAPHRRPAAAGMDRRAARGDGVGHARPRGCVLRHAVRLRLRHAGRGRDLGRGGKPAAADPLGRGRVSQ